MNNVVYLPKENEEEFIEKLSNRIITEYEKKLIQKIIDENFSYLSDSDKREIYLIAEKKAEPDSGNAENTMNFQKRIDIAKNSLREYFKESDRINTDGIVAFRLAKYKDELYTLCQSAADEYSALCEYEDFIGMLKFFVSVQMPKEREVHLIKDKGFIKILNKRKKDITKQYSEEFTLGDNLTSEDIALSALIAISPEKIVIHDTYGGEKLYDTIKQVFSDVKFV